MGFALAAVVLALVVLAGAGILTVVTSGQRKDPDSTTSNVLGIVVMLLVAVCGLLASVFLALNFAG